MKVKVTLISRHDPSKFSQVPDGFWIEGITAESEPVVGERFAVDLLTAASHPRERFRYLHTSVVKEWAVLPNGWSIKTENSTYHIERI